MKTSKLMTLMLVGGALILSACNKSADDSTTISSRSGRGGQTIYTPNGAYYTAQAGTISGNTSGYFNGRPKADYFESVIKDLASASMNKSDIGSIDQNAVTFTGYVELDSSANVIASRSSIQIQINDSKSQGSQPIYLHVGASSTTSGYNHLSGQTITLEFQDSYGWIWLTGTVYGSGTSSMFSGTVNYKNKTNQTPGEAAHEAMNNMLTFQIPTCALFRCH